MSEHNVETIQLGELTAWRVRHNGAELVVARQGAHIVSYQRQGEKPLIWPNDAVVFKKGKGIRTGVPVCWPWFGVFDRNPPGVKAMRHGDDPAGAHGFVRTADWNLATVEREGDALRLDLTLPAPEGGYPEWPHQVDLTLSLLLDDQLHIRLTSHNRGADTVTLSQALHTYFAVSDVRNVQVEGVDGLTYIDTADNWTAKVQDGLLHFSGETDRIYPATPTQLSIVDKDWQRRVQLTSTGSHSTIIWNPWTERAKAFNDMADNGWQGMLCIETANVLEDVVVLEPGAAHTLGVSISAVAL
ncbi:MAG: putative glucose-6-phosphate 1-epimerase [Pseudomonas fluorescens]|nr:MAG: putative glucose-6-phosphate 1-epimerase [Pseudomonas fluorescens]